MPGRVGEPGIEGEPVRTRMSELGFIQFADAALIAGSTRPSWTTWSHWRSRPNRTTWPEGKTRREGVEGASCIINCACVEMIFCREIWDM